MGTATLQTGNAALGTVSRDPQTTAAPPSGGNVPFARLSRKGQILGPSDAGQAMGTLWTPSLKPVGGYLRSLSLTITATTAGASAATASADAPYNVIQNLFLRDPYGQPLVQCGGYSLFLINMYSGQVGALSFGNNRATVPSFTSVSATTGAFRFNMWVPLELDSSGYCSLPLMNASSQPQLQLQTNTSAVVYTSITGSAPTLTLTANEPFWMAPIDNPQAAPADVGSSAQWSESTAAQGVGSAQYQRIQLPRVGTFINTLILVLRDSTGARIDQWPAADLALWVDGVPVMWETLLERTDAMFTQFGVTRPVGVIVYSYRDSLQNFVSNADTYDCVLPTTPATLLEVSGTFGTITNAPAKITAITGELFPLGGIPYTHMF